MSAFDEIFHEMGFSPRSGQHHASAAMYALARTTSLVVRELSTIYQRFGLTAASFNLLMLLQHGQDPASFTQQELSRRLIVSPSDITGLVDRLEKKQLVKRSAGRDRRSKRLRITPKGPALLDEVWPHHVQAITRLTSGLIRTDLDALLAILSRIRFAASHPTTEPA